MKRPAFLLSLIVALALAWAGPRPQALRPAAWGQNGGLPTAQMEIKGVNFTVELAQTPSQQRKGLGGHTPLGPQQGMLFVYSQADTYAFWMKGMAFPIDIIWLNNHQVVHIAHQVPHLAPGTPDSRLPTYRPDQPANFVLELAAGRAAQLGLKPGDTVSYKF